MEEGERLPALGRPPRLPCQREGDDRVQDQGRGPPFLGVLSGQGTYILFYVVS